MKKTTLALLLGLSCSAFAQDADDVDSLYDRLEQQDNTALTALTDVAKRQDPYALSVLGFVYEFGVSVPKNIQQAIDYYQQACALGGDYGCYNAGYFYQYGVGVPQDNARASQLLEKINATDIDINIASKLGHTVYEAKAKAETDVEMRAPILKYVSRYYRSRGRTDETKSRYTAHCVNDSRERQENRQTLPALVLKDESTFFGGNGGVFKCENHFVVDTDKIGEVADLRVTVTLTNTAGVSGKYTLAFAPFGMNTMNENLSGREYSSFRSSTLLAQQTHDFCQRGDVTFQINAATARINGQEKDLLAAGVIKPYVKNAG